MCENNRGRKRENEKKKQFWIREIDTHTHTHTHIHTQRGREREREREREPQVIFPFLSVSSSFINLSTTVHSSGHRLANLFLLELSCTRNPKPGWCFLISANNSLGVKDNPRMAYPDCGSFKIFTSASWSAVNPFIKSLEKIIGNFTSGSIGHIKESPTGKPKHI